MVQYPPSAPGEGDELVRRFARAEQSPQWPALMRHQPSVAAQVALGLFALSFLGVFTFIGLVITSMSLLGAGLLGLRLPHAWASAAGAGALLAVVPGIITLVGAGMFVLFCAR